MTRRGKREREKRKKMCQQSVGNEVTPQEHEVLSAELRFNRTKAFCNTN
jgi:ribonuclease PH